MLTKRILPKEISVKKMQHPQFATAWTTPQKRRMQGLAAAQTQSAVRNQATLSA